MIDFNKTLDPGDIKGGFVNVVIEMPLGTVDKIEWRRQVSEFRLDRTNLTSFPIPTNYGFIPQTLNDDDDELDVLIISEKPIQTEVSLKAKIVGIMYLNDEGDSDDKIIAVPIGNKIETLKDISKIKKDAITNYFEHYKDYIKPGQTKILGWGGVDEAIQVIKKSIWLWSKKND